MAPIENKIWFLKHCELFSQLSQSQLANLERRSFVKSFPKGAPVYLPRENADAIYVVASGLLRIGHITTEGKQSTLAIVEAGDIFGEMALVDDTERGEIVETLKASRLLRIERDAIQELLATDIQISIAFNRILGLRRRRMERRLKNLLFVSSHDRLGLLLLDLVEQFGEASGKGTRIRIRLSHQELANLIGSTRETVTISLAKMKREGLLSSERNTLIIKELEMMKKRFVN
ncbi:MAG: Crp/Fnr family transcriptional regulator [Pirellulaceae bacterium]